jgi:replicative DNA helicase
MTDFSAKVPPQDKRAEDEVAASLVDWPKAVGILVEQGLRPEDFYLRKPVLIYRAAQRVMLEGRDCNAVSIWSALQAMGYSKPGNDEGLERHEIEALVGHSTAFGGIGSYGERIMERADRRRKQTAGQRLITAVDSEDEKTYANQVQEALEEATRDYQAESEPTTPEEIASFVFDYIESEDEPDCFPLPWPKLNKGLPGGLLRGQTSVWAGWTNMGKSVAVDEAMSYWHKQGRRCGLIATEMSLLERMSRKLMMASGISALRILTKRLTQEEKGELAKLIQPQNIPFSFYDAQGWNYERIAQLITLKRFDVVAIDPINLIQGFADQETMTEAAGRFQAVARRANTHLMLVCHLNRKRSPQGSAKVLPKPHVYDIRDSGMIANNSDQTLFVHRDQDEEGEVLPVGEIYLDKVRVGFKSKTRVSLDPKYLRFTEIVDVEHDAGLPGVLGAVA